jgi:hypothetical protein
MENGRRAGRDQRGRAPRMAALSAAMHPATHASRLAPRAMPVRQQQRRAIRAGTLLQSACLLLLVDAAGAESGHHRPAFCDISSGIGVACCRARALTARRPGTPWGGSRGVKRAARRASPSMQHGGGESSEEGIGERESKGLSDLSLLGAFGKLRAGMPTSTRELPKPSRINESFEIQVCLQEKWVEMCLFVRRVQLKIAICTQSCACALQVGQRSSCCPAVLTLGALRLVRATTDLKSVVCCACWVCCARVAVRKGDVPPENQPPVLGSPDVRGRGGITAGAAVCRCGVLAS